MELPGRPESLRYQRLTGLPVVLGTSLGENESAVCTSTSTSTEAVEYTERTRMDALAAGTTLAGK